MRILKLLILVAALAATLLTAGGRTARAESVSVACAANFTAPMKRLAAMFEELSGVRVEPTFGSTGLLFGQIVQGAPFHLFFAADVARPATLHDRGLARAPRTYATGEVVLWSALPLTGESWAEAVADPAVVKIGLANPETAPYGAVAVAALEKAGLLEAVRPKLVYGKNVGQAFQFAWSGGAEAAFVALSQARSEQGRTGTLRRVPTAPLVTQDCCLLAGAGEDAARFLAFVLSDPDAREVVREYGYR